VIRVDCRSGRFITGDLVISEACRRWFDTDCGGVLGRGDPSRWLGSLSLLGNPLKSVSSKGSSLLEGSLLARSAF
jgi:hypothetical protein